MKRIFKFDNEQAVIGFVEGVDIVGEPNLVLEKAIVSAAGKVTLIYQDHDFDDPDEEREIKFSSLKEVVKNIEFQ